MSDRHWQTRTAGDPVPDWGAVALDPDLDGQVPVLMGDTRPDVVRLPAELGGAVVRCTGTRRAPCMSEGHDHTVRWYDLESDVVATVAECPDRGFLFYGPQS